jgi:hypothetical protein
MIAPIRELPSPFGRGTGGEGIECEANQQLTPPNRTALTLTLSQRERGPALAPATSVTKNACKLCAPLGERAGNAPLEEVVMALRLT